MVIGIEESYCGGDVAGFSTRAAVSESEGNNKSKKKNNVILVTQYTIYMYFSRNN